ncbi:PAS domain-containing sensor histidine kinase [Haloterrigena alkaliphila]|uniref:histidine kinase n=1 Tax=Haloterrigena alkaliphila TaxID=2816475 RepID=A0A8A2VFU1_9EURY|nr:PAS domain S-box protein [Haloterrigena alkaliphila]QSW99222.1 PAS domain S-box protein [Haloterrigena alkaliphila]
MGSSDSTGVTGEDVRRIFSESGRSSAPLTTAEVADRLERSPPAVEGRLEELADRGELRTKRIDESTRIWWRDQEEAGTTPRTGQEEFAAFVSAVQDYAIFMLDPDGVVASWNEGAERIKGYEEHEIVGQHFSTFYSDDDIDNDVPQTNLETAASEGRVEDEGWRLRSDGTEFWANVVITAIRDDEGRLQGFTKVTRDMTERREYELQLQRERDLTERILETVPITIGVVTEDGELVRANRRMLDRFDIEADALAAYSVDSWDLYDTEGELIPTDEWPWARAFRSDEPVYNQQYQVDIPEIGRRWLSLNAAPLEDDHHDDDRVVVAIDDITPQKERERLLRREYNQTEKLLRTAPIAIAVQNAEGETVLTNRRAQEALGLSDQEFIGESDGDDWEVRNSNGDPLDPDETPAARVLETGEPVFDEELVVDSPDGEQLQFRMNATPIVGPEGEIDRVVTAAEDITELKDREQQLEDRKTELETELSEILGRISDAFYAIDDEWRLTHLNEYAAEIMQESREELLGRKIWETLPDETEESCRERFQEAMETQEPVNFEVYADEFDAWLEYNVYPSESGLSIYFHEITERKEYQRKLEKSNERLEQFAYAASHDLQEPLRMVSSYLRLLEDRYTDQLDSNGEEFIEFAVDGADRMRDMIDGLLAYSRVDTQGEPLEPVDLNTVLEAVLDDLQVKIEEHDAEILSDSLPRVRGDESQLQQVLQNLVSNGIEYSGDEPPRIHVSAERARSKWVISVRDEGIGIDPEDQDRIFQVFERLHSREEYSGTGIGLALCQRIVERHEGTIWVNSEPGEGTTFSFTLPAADS